MEVSRLWRQCWQHLLARDESSANRATLPNNPCCPGHGGDHIVIVATGRPQRYAQALDAFVLPPPGYRRRPPVRPIHACSLLRTIIHTLATVFNTGSNVVCDTSTTFLR